MMIATILFSAAVATAECAKPITEYEPNLQDRCWMFGHDPGQHDRPGNVFNIPPSAGVSQAEACRIMGVSNLIVCIWNHPGEEYRSQFKDLKRVSWAVENGWTRQVRKRDVYAAQMPYVESILKTMPNLMGADFDDFFYSEPRLDSVIEKLEDGSSITVATGPMGVGELRRARKRIASWGRPIDMRIIVYSRDIPVPGIKPVIDVFDTVQFWTWDAADLARLRENFTMYRKIVPDKPTFLGMYMWDFGGKKPVGVDVMRGQLDFALEKFRSGEIDGVIFHCTPLVDKNIPEVEMCRKWIAEHGRETIGRRAPSAAVANAAATFHLKPGATNGDGSESAPFGTFAETQGSVRKAVADASLPPGKVTVIVHDGTYRVNKAVAFGKEDSGTAAHPIVWRAENKGKVRVTGGIPVPEFSPLVDSDPNWKRIQKRVRENILVADLKAAGISDYGEVKTQGLGGPYMELVYGDEPQTLARWPNEGYAEIADAESSAEQNPEKRKFYPRGFKYSGDRPSYWADEPEACMNGFFFYWWAAHRVAVGSIDPETKTILQKGGGDDRSKRPNAGSIWGYKKGQPWYGYNILRELDAPGEYYIDRRIGRLYFWPPKGNSTAGAELTMSEGVFAFDGVEDVSLSGFVFENCRGVAFAARGCKNVEVTACVLRNVGGWAAEMKGCQDCRMAGCDIAWCNEGGVAMTGGDPKTLAHGNVVVENCHIHHFGRMQLTYCGGVDATGCGLAVRHNTIHDGPHLGVILRNISRECEVSWNELHSLCLESGEMGAFYAGRDWTLCGIRVEANWFHDIYNLRPQPNRAVMIDDGAAGLTVVSNWFTRVSEGVSLSGIGNVVENNVFMDCGVAITGWGCWKKPGDLTNPRMVYQDMLDRFAALPVHEEPWKSRYPYLGLIDEAIKNNTVRDPATRTTIRKNIWLNAVYAPILHFSGKIWDGLYSPVAWLEENNSEAGQPEPDGFATMPPLYKIGVQNTPDRATWPVLHSVTVKGNSLKPDYWWLK